MTTQKTQKVKDLIQDLSNSTYEVLCLESKSYLWNSEEEASFRSALKRVNDLVIKIESILEDPECKNTLKECLPLDDEKMKALFDESKNTIDTWNQILDALD